MRAPRRLLLLAGGALLALLALLLLLPAPIDPRAWTPPPPAPLSGPFAPNQALRAGRRIAEGRLRGPEDVAVDGAGRLYTGSSDGRILRVGPDGSVADFARTGGRPLGLRFDPAGNLLVCDSYKGLLSIDSSGRVRVLATAAEGVSFRFTNNLDVGGDGTVYFSDASAVFGQNEYLFDLLEARPHGRLLRYDPGTGETRVLLSGLYFANGVALSRDEDFVLVNETYRYRITRLWLKGPRTGRSDVFADDLPGFPDNLDGDRQGSFWLALFTVRNPVVDALHPHPWMKRLLSRLPKPLWPKPQPYGLVLELDEQGRILRSLHDPGGQVFSQITTARAHDGKLYLGTLDAEWLGVVELPTR